MTIRRRGPLAGVRRSPAPSGSSPMSRLFGTDGIRGVANVDLKPTLAYALGRAAASRLVGPGGALVVGQDTRRSGDMFVAALAAGATSLGADVHVVGVVPTPALAFLAASGPIRGRDHGLGVAQPGGRQRPQGPRQRRAQARRRDRGRARAADLAGRGAARRAERRARPGGRRDGAARPLPRAPAGARRAVRADGLRVVLDCANGSGSAVAPEILAATGATVEVIHAEPDGVNINVECGATAPASLARRGPSRARRRRRVRARRRRRPADRGRRGAARSSTATRCSASSPSTGSARDALPGGGLVVSVLSNGGLQAAVEAAGGHVVRTPVGDKYILEGMQVSGAGLGGEKSGHVIVLEHTTSGDGIVTALEVLAGHGPRRPAAGRARRARSRCCPQQQRAVKVRHKDQWEGDRVLQGAIAAASERLGPTRSGPRPAVGHRARAAGDGRGAGRSARDRAGRRARDPRGGATKLAGRACSQGAPPGRPVRLGVYGPKETSACAASSATPDRGRRARS